MSHNDFKYLSQEFSHELLKLVKQKGVYPYEYMNNFKKFPNKKLPDKSKFYSSVKDEYISEKKYLYAIDVWDTLQMKQWVIIMIFT